MAPVTQNPCQRCGLFHSEHVPCPVCCSFAQRGAGRELAPGTVLADRFTVREVVHRSQMSTIYRAHDRANRLARLAIKQVSVAGLPAEDQEAGRRWLAREAGLLSSLRSSHLPSLVAAFSEGDEHYVVMDFLEGKTLKELVTASGPLNSIVSFHWMSALLDLLCYLHSQDPPIVHRDLAR